MAADSFEDLELLTKDELIEMLREKAEAGVKISFPGKATARRLSRLVRPRVQRTVLKYSAGTEEDRARNHLIEGDNLQAMATLYRERGHIDLILTDPPYNTGGDWRYNDKWDEDPNDPGIGEIVGSDDRAKHTKWMRFMYPRLVLMRHMLKPGGVLAICIDHRELFHLGQMLDELFGEQNRLAIINWQKSYSPRSDNTHVSTATEYVLVYAKDEDRARTGLLPRTEEMDARYHSPDGDERVWKGENFSGPKAKTHQGMVYGIQSPFTGDVHYPPEGKCWRAPQKDALDWAQQWGVDYELRFTDDADTRAKIIGAQVGEIRRVKALMLAEDVAVARAKAEKVLADEIWPELVFGLDGQGRPQQKKYLENVKKGRVPMTYWADEDHDELPDALGSVSWDHEESGHSQSGINELSAVVGKGHGFETVKPLMLMEKIIHIWCPPDGVVLDVFAGSGTTGHAVLALNHVSGTDRRFILVEQGRPENGDSYARTLTADRLQRAVSGVWANGKGKPLGGGYEFRYLTKQVDATALLAMERDEMVDTVVASYFDSARRRGPGLIRRNDHDWTYLVAQNTEGEGFYLVWGGVGQNTDLTEEVYEACVAESDKAELQQVYHIYSRFNLFTTPGVIWYQIPDRILADFGLDVRTESYDDGDAGA